MIQVGDRLRRTAVYEHGGIYIGDIVTVTWVSSTGRHFHCKECSLFSSEGEPYRFSIDNFEFVSHGKEKKLSGFGKFIRQIEGDSI